MAGNFTLSMKAVDDVVVLVPKGYINDLGAARMEQASEQCFDKGTRKFIINFADMYFINSIGASVITGIVNKNLEREAVLCFTNMKKMHRDVFEMLGITRHVRVFREEGDALIFLHEGE